MPDPIQITVTPPSAVAVNVAVPGPQGLPGADGRGMQWRGAWEAATDYVLNDGVSYQGQSYVALQPSTNVAPDSDPLTWDVFAAKGADGAPGAEGPQGEPGPQGEQGPQGDPGPQGEPGDVGPAGPAGADGASAYALAVADGFVGTEAEWLASLVGPQGPAGADGADGADGAQGPAGADGTNGTDGADGASAYEIAVANGFVGTEEEWLASLVGPQGPAGDDGSGGGFANPMTTQGDLIVGQATGTPDRLAVGANGTAMVADDTAANGLRYGFPTRRTVTVRDAAYTALATDDVILCTGTWTLALPPAAGVDGLCLTIKNVGGGTITVDPDGSELVGGGTTKPLAPGSATVLLSDGATWWVLSESLALAQTGELLTNGGFETGDLTGWTLEPGYTDGGVATHGDHGNDLNSLPRSGMYLFFPNAGAESRYYQSIDVSGHAEAIDRGRATAAAIAWFSSDDSPEACSLYLEFQDAAHAPLSFYISGEISPSPNYVWQPISAILPLPTGTRFLKFQFRCRRLSGTNNNSDVDDCSLKLNLLQ